MGKRRRNRQKGRWRDTSAFMGMTYENKQKTEVLGKNMRRATLNIGWK